MVTVSVSPCVGETLQPLISTSLSSGLYNSTHSLPGSSPGGFCSNSFITIWVDSCAFAGANVVRPTVDTSNIADSMVARAAVFVLLLYLLYVACQIVILVFIFKVLEHHFGLVVGLAVNGWTPYIHCWFDRGWCIRLSSDTRSCPIRDLGVSAGSGLRSRDLQISPPAFSMV